MPRRSEAALPSPPGLVARQPRQRSLIDRMDVAARRYVKVRLRDKAAMEMTVTSTSGKLARRTSRRLVSRKSCNRGIFGGHHS